MVCGFFFCFLWGTWFERRKYFHHIIKSTSPRTPYPHVPGVLTVCLCLSPEQLSRQPVGTTQCKRCPPSMSSTAPCPQPGRVCEGWGRIHLHMLFIGLRATACPSSHGVLTPRRTGPGKGCSPPLVREMLPVELGSKWKEKWSAEPVGRSQVGPCPRVPRCSHQCHSTAQLKYLW